MNYMGHQLNYFFYDVTTDRLQYGLKSKAFSWEFFVTTYEYKNNGLWFAMYGENGVCTIFFV